MNELSSKELARLKAFATKNKAEGRDSGIAKTLRATQGFAATNENKNILMECWQDWTNMAPIREEHRRNQRYKNNKQWDDLIPDPKHKGHMITERENISRRGRTPLSNNLIDPIVRNIHGQALSSPTQPVVISRAADDTQLGEMLTNTLQKALQLNKYNITRTSALESLISSGYAIGKIRYGYWYTKNRTDVKIDFVSINRFFFNQDAEDPRLDDICRCGEIHDLSWQQLIRDFNVTGKDAEALQNTYGRMYDEAPALQNTAEENLSYLDFIGASNPGKYRVIEVWSKCNREVEYVHDPVRGVEIFDEQHSAGYYERENEKRREQLLAAGLPLDIIESKLINHRTIIEEYWEGRWLTPMGECLKIMETPYEHQSHPYVIASMPRIDGISRPILSNLCEIQRTANRHLTMIDFALANAAKGVLLVPRSARPKDMTLEEFAEAYSRTDGVIEYDDTNPMTKAPTQLSSSPIPAGAFDFLRTEWDALKEVSGLSGALQGQVARNNTPSSLYAQQAQNSMLNFMLLFECFKDFNTLVAEKSLQVIMQYYNTRRYVDISGKDYSGTASYYEPEMVGQIVEWNIVIADSSDTPVFRQTADEFLKYLFEAQAINVEMLLENSSLPFAQKLLAQINAAKETAQQGGDWAAQVQGLQLPGNNAPQDPQAALAIQQLANSQGDMRMIQNPSAA